MEFHMKLAGTAVVGRTDGRTDGVGEGLTQEFEYLASRLRCEKLPKFAHELA